MSRERQRAGTMPYRRVGETACRRKDVRRYADTPLRRYSTVWLSVTALMAISLLVLRGAAQSAPPGEDELWQHRNLGKAFYENPTTQLQAVDEFKKALDLAPQSARERLNYGLALLRAGQIPQGMAELQNVQQQDPQVPHTWFNLGILFKKQADYGRAIQQFEQMVALVPGEPISHYNLGVLYKMTGQAERALNHFRRAAELGPHLAGPHFQLFTAYRMAGKLQEAAREEKIFQEIRQRQKGAAIPEDLEWSVFAEIYETIDPRPLEAGAPTELKFHSQPLSGDFDVASAGLAALNYDGDEKPDLVVWSAQGVRLYRGGLAPVEAPGLAGLKGVVSVAPGDFDNDGLHDLCIVTGAGPMLYQNLNGSLEKRPVELPAGRYAKAVWLDYDRDYDIDLFLLGEKSSLARNNGNAGFSDQSADFPFVAGEALDAVVYDLVMDTNGIDLLVSYKDRTGVLYRDKLGGKYEATVVEDLSPGSRWLVGYDIDNNGWTDIAAVTPGGVILLHNQGSRLRKVPLAQASGPVFFADFENRAAGELVVGHSLWRNMGDAQLSGGRSLPGLSEVVAAVAADFDADGLADIAAVSSDGRAYLLRNQTSSSNQWFRVSLQGVRNLKLAPGAEVEVKAGNSYQKKIYQGVPLVFGLQSRKNIETVRITWPNGLIQNELKQAAGRFVNLKEAQRLSGSCPMIFTWDGKGFRFITDVLGVAPLGASAGEGEYFPVDHDEYVQIPGEALVSVDGHYQVRITEELREAAFLDQVRLITVDHPASLQIFINDKFKAPPFPEFRLYGVKRKLYPRSARDHYGRDVRAEILASDRLYAAGYRRDHSGVAEMHNLDLDFGRVAPGNRAVLILSGWVDWADGSTFLGAAQQSAGGLVMPYLQVRDRAGRWQTVIADMGIPAGKPKVIAVDLSGKFTSESREVRIATNLCVYWDQIFLSDQTAAPPARLSFIDADQAELRFRGFSRPLIHPERKQPEGFDYSRLTTNFMWNPTPGLYTRFGDVLPLVRNIDDCFIIMGSGDELRLKFSAAGLPAVPQGWKRDFLLLVDGWAKDGDANTAYSQTVEPLPFHRMSRYPYSQQESFPADDVHKQYRNRYNTRPALRLVRPLG